MNKPIPKIKQEYSTYKSLINEEKVAKESPIYLGEKDNNVHWEIGSSPVKHIDLNENMELIVERCKRELKYGIKLRCSSFTETPVFRFDSAGPTHRNSRSSLIALEQQITTPHFNCYTPDGRSFAYKNKPLLDDRTAAAIQADMDFGMDLFCKEANVLLLDGSYPLVREDPSKLPLPISPTVDYDKIDFK